MKGLLLLTCLLALSVPASAQAVTLVNPDGTRAEPYQTWADRAKVPTVDQVVTVTNGEGICPPARSCARPSLSSIGLRPADRSAHGTGHELGHYFPLTPAKQQTFLTIVGRQVPWHGEGMSGAEIFAESYAACFVGVTPRGRERVQLGYGFATRTSTLRRVCRMIRS